MAHSQGVPADDYEHPAEIWRTREGISQSEFCRQAGLSISQYCEVTRQLRNSFGRRAMHRIVDATDGQVTYEELMDWDRDMHWTPEAKAKRQTRS